MGKSGYKCTRYAGEKIGADCWVVCAYVFCFYADELNKIYKSTVDKSRATTYSQLLHIKLHTNFAHLDRLIRYTSQNNSKTNQN